jgi:cadmium resistance protein CadD (predicted permease)
VWAVAGITIANGGDNVAVYVPFLATLEPAEVGVVVAPVFAAMTVAWVAAAALAGTRPAFVALVDRAGRFAVPVVLILLGVWIVADSGLVGAVVP